MADYRNLEVWQKAMELTMMIYDAADTFPAIWAGEPDGESSRFYPF